jgi:hypothetical protein
MKIFRKIFRKIKETVQDYKNLWIVFQSIEEEMKEPN